MSRKRKRNKRSKRPTKQKIPLSVSGRLVRLALKLGGPCLALCTVLGVILWLPFYVANIHIDSSASSNDPLMPLPPSFSITNSGILTAYSVQGFCYIINVQVIVKGKLVTIRDSAVRPTFISNALSSGQIVDVSCPGIVGPLTKESDIEFLVSYQPAFTWIRSYTCARFVIKENAYGRLQWFRTEPQECKPLWIDLQNRTDKGKAETEALRKRFSK